MKERINRSPCPTQAIEITFPVCLKAEKNEDSINFMHKHGIPKSNKVRGTYFQCWTYLDFILDVQIVVEGHQNAYFPHSCLQPNCATYEKVKLPWVLLLASGGMPKLIGLV